MAFAYAQLGKPYRFFTAGPNTFDCSGLVKAAYAQIGIQLVHHARSQATMGTAVDIWNEPIKAGDLIFMATHGDPNEITHVGIAVDATHWIHAPKPGDVVRLAPIPPKGILTSVQAPDALTANYREGYIRADCGMSDSPTMAGSNGWRLKISLQHRLEGFDRLGRVVGIERFLIPAAHRNCHSCRTTGDLGMHRGDRGRDRCGGRSTSSGRCRAC